MKKTRGKGINSASYLVEMAAVPAIVEIPASVRLNVEESELWPQFASARARNDWREFDLILLAKIVKLEANIRKYTDMFDKSGAIIRNAKGTPITNPLLTVVDVLTRQQMSIIRSLSLTAGGGDPRTQTAHALQQRTFNAIRDTDPDGLLAHP